MIDKTFLSDIQESFNVKRFSMERNPIEGFSYSPGKPRQSWDSKDHWMIKLKSHPHIFLDELEPDVRRFVQKSIDFMKAFDLPLEDRYLYLTVDDRNVEQGFAQRREGWHFDGMQGSEVPTPKAGCFQFTWSNHSGTEYTNQKFKTKGLNRHSINLFDSLGNQIDDSCVKTMEPGTAYLSSPYQVHRTPVLKRSGQRKFLRLSASHQPITSTKMSLNPRIKYDYPVHSTSGEIPLGLVTLYHRKKEDHYKMVS